MHQFFDQNFDANQKKSYANQKKSDANQKKSDANQKKVDANQICIKNFLICIRFSEFFLRGNKAHSSIRRPLTTRQASKTIK